MKPSKVLVTGGFGYAGSRLVPHLLELGHQVRVLDLMLYTEAGLHALEKNPSFTKWKGRFDFIQGDIRNPEDVQRAVSGMEAIIHLAAISNDPTGEIDDTLTRQVNFDAVGLLLSLARAGGVRPILTPLSTTDVRAQGRAALCPARPTDSPPCQFRVTMTYEMVL